VIYRLPEFCPYLASFAALEKKGFQASLFKGNYQKNVGFKAPSFQGGANPKSKIVRLSVSALSLSKGHAEVQNPKSGDSAAFPGRLTIMPTAATKMVNPAFIFYLLIVK
jgi:hypothetical protein